MAEEEDYKNALLSLRKLASAGYVTAQYELAQLYENGTPMRRDISEAKNWYKLAAVNGHSKAQINLGCLYLDDEAISRGYKKSLYWFLRAADNDSSIAFYNLGNLYECGEGMDIDLLQAYKWYKLSADSGDEDAEEKILQLDKKLSKDQIKKALKLIEKYLQKR